MADKDKRFFSRASVGRGSAGPTTAAAAVAVLLGVRAKSSAKCPSVIARFRERAELFPMVPDQRLVNCHASRRPGTCACHDDPLTSSGIIRSKSNMGPASLLEIHAQCPQRQRAVRLPEMDDEVENKLSGTEENASRTREKCRQRKVNEDASNNRRGSPVPSNFTLILKGKCVRPRGFFANSKL